MNSGIERQYRVLVAFEGWKVGDMFTTEPTIRLSALVASGYLAQSAILRPGDQSLDEPVAEPVRAKRLPRDSTRRTTTRRAASLDADTTDTVAVFDTGSYIGNEYGGSSSSYDSGSSSSSDSGSSGSGGGGE